MMYSARSGRICLAYPFGGGREKRMVQGRKYFSFKKAKPHFRVKKLDIHTHFVSFSCFGEYLFTSSRSSERLRSFAKQEKTLSPSMTHFSTSFLMGKLPRYPQFLEVVERLMKY